MSADKEKGIASEVDTRLEDLFGDEKEAGAPQENKTTEVEVSSRLDELFGEGQPKIAADNPKPTVSEPKKEKKAAPAPIKTETAEKENPLLKELKSVILSLEWEISDQLMVKLEEELKFLEDKCKEDKIIIGFVQLMNSLGKYIRKKKAVAHPDSVVLLRSVYDSMEKVVQSPELTEVAKKKMLVVELNKYKELKSQILIKPEPARKQMAGEAGTRKPFAEETAPPAEIPPFSLADQEQTIPITVEDTGISPMFEEKPEISTVSDIAGIQDIVRMLEEINRTIKTEFGALIAELQLLREKR